MIKAQDNVVAMPPAAGAPDADNTHLLAVGAARPLLPIVAPVVAQLGYALVRVRLQQAVLQIMAERIAASGAGEVNAGGNLSLDDCATISHALSAVLDVEDPIAGAYRLEVSSPGLDRPLTRVADFTRYRGHYAQIKMAQPIEGRTRFRGVLRDMVDGEVHLEVMLDGYSTPQILGLALAQISEAVLLADEASWRAALREAKSAKHKAVKSNQ